MPSPQFVVPCDELEATIDWFTETAGFRLMMITPADNPTVAVLEGHGVELRLDRSMVVGATGLRIPVEVVPEVPTLSGPNGTRIEFVAIDPPDRLPVNVPEFVLSRAADADFGAGRAGMQYRDLIPQRQGGRYIASHISIPVGGPVADYVHHHHIRFQMIFCHAGWAELVYEDQGSPFRFEAGDCVLQPPHIRHRVLETSDEFEVVEIGSPAVHDTLRDHDLELPTFRIDHDRDFGGQRFVWHCAAEATWSDHRYTGFSAANFGIDKATGGLAEVGSVRAEPGAMLGARQADDEFLLWFVRVGEATLIRQSGEGRAEHQIGPRDGIVLAAGETYELANVSPDYEFLEVRIP